MSYKAQKLLKLTFKKIYTMNTIRELHRSNEFIHIGEMEAFFLSSFYN